MANGGDNEDLFHAAMGDSPSMNYMPLYSDSYPEELFSRFASLAWVPPSITLTIYLILS